MAKKIKTGAQFTLEGKEQLGAPFRSAGTIMQQFKATALNPMTIAIAAGTAAFAAITIAAVKFGKTLGGIIQETAVLGDETAKAAKRIGISAGQMSAWGLAADRAGASARAIKNSFRFLAKAAVEARDGVETYKDVFDALGVTVELRSGELKDMETLFLEVADAVGKTENKTEALGLAQQLLGRNAAELSVLFDDQRVGIEEVLEQAEKLGGKFSDELAQASEDLIDAQTDLKFAFQGVKNELSEAFIPILIRATDFITAFIVANKDKLTEIIDKVAAVVNAFIVDMTAFVDESGPAVLQWFKETAIAASNITEAIETVNTALDDLNSGPLGVLKDLAGLGSVGEVALIALANAGGPLSGLAAAILNVGTAQSVLNELMGDTTETNKEFNDTTQTAIELGRDEADAAAAFNANLEHQIELLDAVKIAKLESFPSAPPVEQPPEEDIPGDIQVPEENIPELPTPEDLDEFTKGVHEANEAVKMLGDQAVESFTNQMGGAARQMINSMSQAAGKALLQQASFAETAKKLWQGFISSILGMIVQLIAKLAIAAALQAFLGIGNFSGIGSLASILGGFKQQAKEFHEGGIVEGARNVRSEVPALLLPGEAVLNKGATEALGKQTIDELNLAGRAANTADILGNAGLPIGTGPVLTLSGLGGLPPVGEEALQGLPAINFESAPPLLSLSGLGSLPSAGEGASLPPLDLGGLPPIQEPQLTLGGLGSLRGPIEPPLPTSAELFRNVGLSLSVQASTTFGGEDEGDIVAGSIARRLQDMGVLG